VAKLDRTSAAGPVVHVSIGGGGDTIILDLAAHTSAVLWPTQKTYARAKDVGPAELYGTGSMPTFTRLSTTPAWSGCTGPARKVRPARTWDNETLDGRDTVKYELSCYGEVCRLWIDRKLRVLIKRESEWNSTEPAEHPRGGATAQPVRRS
jgi:hypothetical protein